MPPARKPVCPYPVITDTAAKSRWPRHVINIQDLRGMKNDNDKYHLVLKIDEFSPEKISIKRNGNTLNIDSEKKDENCVGEDGVEHIARSYEIPEGGYTEEFGAQISVDGLLGVRTNAKQKMTGHIIPINIDSLLQLKSGKTFNLNTAEWQNTCPIKVTYLDKKGVLQSHQIEAKKEGQDGYNNEGEKKTIDTPVNNNDQEMEVTGANAGDSKQGGLPDESVQI